MSNIDDGAEFDQQPEQKKVETVDDLGVDRIKSGGSPDSLAWLISLYTNVRELSNALQDILDKAEELQTERLTLNMITIIKKDLDRIAPPRAFFDLIMEEGGMETLLEFVENNRTRGG